MEILSMHNWIQGAEKRFLSEILIERILWWMYKYFFDSPWLYSLKIVLNYFKSTPRWVKSIYLPEMNWIESFWGTHLNFPFINGKYSAHEKLYFSFGIVFVNIWKEIMIKERKLSQIHYVLTSSPKRDESSFNERWIFHFSLFHYLFNFSKI